MEQKLVSFENTYQQNKEDLSYDMRGPAVKGCITIDGYPENENQEGEVVCRVYMTDNDCFLIEWHNNAYRMNKAVLELIEQSIQILTEQHPREEIPYSLMVFPEIEFDNGTAVICKYHGQHNHAPKSDDIMSIVNAVKDSYEAAGMKVIRASPVSERAYDLFEARDSLFPTEEKQTPLDKTTISWHDNDISISENMLTKNLPDKETRLCRAIHQSWENGFTKNKAAEALIDMYALSQQKTLFCQMFETAIGKNFCDYLTMLIQTDETLAANVSHILSGKNKTDRT